MVIYPSMHSLREAGFKVPFNQHGPRVDDLWVIVGEWDSEYVPDDTNASIQIEQLRATFGSRRCAELRQGQTRVIAAEDCDDVATLVREQQEWFEERGTIDDTVFWNKVSPLVEETWASLNASGRIRLIRENDAPPDLLFAETIPDEFFSEVASWVTAG